tara:strand:+ start:522 stop:1139 length:618 start_codon:yes stop_codon:yes gene_type:complete
MTFALVKHNNNSISAITSAGQLAQGKMTLLQTQTASSSASISFTSNIDSTYPIYMFKFINIHPATNNAYFTFQGNASGGSGFNETMTTTVFYAYHNEAGNDTLLGYIAGSDQAQGTGFQRLINDGIGNGNDECASGELTLFNPSSTTFVKHFIARTNNYYNGTYSMDSYTAGYFNTTSAIDEIQFKMSSGNIDSGTIKLYGIKGS